MSRMPKLRFKTFTDEWKVERLGKYLSEFKEKSTIQDQYPVMTSSNRGLMLQTEYYDNNRITDRENVGFNIIPSGYVTYRSRSDNRTFTFNVNSLGYTGIISTYYPVFKFENGDDKFFTELMRVHSHHIGTHSVGTSQTVLAFNELKRIKLPLPSKLEQQKIASFLSAVDTKIDLLTRKKELLEQYKKGVMQKIFSQELRFKADDGSEFPEWEEKRLGEIAIRKTLKNKENAFNFVLTNSATQGIVSQQDYFDKDIANQNNLEGYYIVDIDDFVYNPRISVSAPVGPIKRNKLAKGVMSPLYTVFAFSNVNLSYMECYFDTTNWHEYMNSIANFGARHDRMNVTNKDFMEMPLLLPTMEEQTKIANFLAVIDTKIDLVTKQLDEAKNFKKGLLQQMFV